MYPPSPPPVSDSAPPSLVLDDQPIDGAGLGCWEVDARTDIARYSRRWVSQLGYNVTDLRATAGNWRRMCHPEDLPRIALAVDQLLDGRESRIDVEMRIRRRDGQWQWVRSLGQISRRAADGQPLTLSGVHIDISSRRALVESLERREQRLRLALSAGNEGWWDWQLDSDRCEYGDYWTSLFGASPDPDATGIDAWLARVHGADLKALRTAIAACRDGSAAALDHEHRVMAADGKPRWMLARARVVEHSAYGVARRIAGVVVDISERKQADLALARSTALIEAVQALQQRFIAHPDLRQLGDELLRTMLEFGEAEYGFIGEVLRDSRGAPYLKTFTLTNIAWNDEMRALYNAHHVDGLEFRNLDTLFGETLRTGQLVIANTPSEHHAARGLPSGHPALNTYAGVPIHDGRQLIGMVGLGNRHAGFDEQILELIRPLTSTIGVMIKAMRSERERAARADELLRVSRLAIAAEARLREITDGLPAVVFQFSFEATGKAHFNFVSRAIQQIAGSGPDLITSRPKLFLRQVRRDDRRKLLHALERCRGDAHSMQLSFRLRDGSGVSRWLDATLSRGDGRVWNGFLFDVTERKRTERELSEARDSADAANRAKSSFIATISHEIRTPLHGALGLIELMKLGPLSGAQADNLRLIDSSGKSLLRLIDDLLDFSRMERSQLEIRSEPAALRDEITRTAEFWAEAARAKRLPLQLDIDPAVPSTVSVDTLRLRQILDNLLSNAIKFTASGLVRLRVKVLPTAASTSADSTAANLRRVAFEVIDSGIGIPVALQKRLFQPFVQADHDTARQFGGSGLGLSIARGLAERMNGSLSLASQPGRGTTMTLLLNLPCLDEPQQPALTGERGGTVGDGVLLQRPTVLVAEDNAVNRILVAQQLKHLGYPTRIADSGEMALAIWRDGGCALLLTDCHMGGMDGFELTRTIRREEQARGLSPMPIIACTADVYAGIVETCLSVGMNGWIGKPVSLDALRRKLAKWLGGKTTMTPAIADAAHSEPALALHDADALRQLTGGDPALGRDLLAAFRASLDAERDAVRAALDRGDLVAIQRTLHRLLGACRSACVPRLARKVADLEDCARQSDRSAVLAGWPTLQALIADTAAALSVAPENPVP
ncbi:MAG: PAS domain-containing protein [Gammaproteobacteria bacterium]|nr:PAS domain-containing protein [Gammaproteobacteria bacterium]